MENEDFVDSIRELVKKLPNALKELEEIKEQERKGWVGKSEIQIEKLVRRKQSLTGLIKNTESIKKDLKKFDEKENRK